MLVSQINPEEVELLCNAKTSIGFIKQIWPLVTRGNLIFLII